MRILRNTKHTENSTNINNKKTNSEIINRAYLIKYLFTHGEKVDEKFVIKQELKNDYYSEPVSNTAS